MNEDRKHHPDLLTIKQVAERLQLGKNKVYALANNGAIPAFRVGGSIRVPHGALQAWIETQCSLPVQQAENF